MTAVNVPWIDLIRDGVPDVRDASGKEYDVAVWHGLNRTAVCARYAGWDFARWSLTLDESISKLGLQAKRAGNKRERPRQQYMKLLLGVWAKAEKYVIANPVPDAVEVLDRIEDMRLVVADADTKFLGNRRTIATQRAVLAAVCEIAAEFDPERNKVPTVRPAVALPRVMEMTGLTKDQVRSALKRLCESGLLTREIRGDVRKHRAALYRLRPEAALSSTTYTPNTELRGETAQSYVVKTIASPEVCPEPSPKPWGKPIGVRSGCDRGATREHLRLVPSPVELADDSLLVATA